MRRSSIKPTASVTDQYSRDAVYKVLEHADYKTLMSVIQNYKECREMVCNIVKQRLCQQNLLIIVHQDVSEKVAFEFEFFSIDTTSGVVTFKAKPAIGHFQRSYSVKPTISQIFIGSDQHNVLIKPMVLNIGRIDVRSVSSKSDWTFVYETACNTIHRSTDRVVVPISFECRLDLFMPAAAISPGKRVTGLFRRNSWKRDLLQKCEDMHYQLHSRVTHEKSLVCL